MKTKYHIHIDAQKISEELAEFIRKSGFVDHHFIGHPQGYRHFSPNFHLTRKFTGKQDFLESWRVLEERINNAKEENFRGYIEGECIRLDKDFPFKEYVTVPVPFTIERKQLHGPPQDRGFRETEVHVVMDYENSNQALIKSFLDAGLYGALLPKIGHTGIVLTIQGSVKDIRPLISVIDRYLTESGGAVQASLKEEVAVKHLIKGISYESLPEIADKIIYQ